MSHARLHNAVIAGWPTRTMTTAVERTACRQNVGKDALIDQAAGTPDKPPTATTVLSTPMLQPIIPCRGRTAKVAAAAGVIIPRNKVLTEENVFVNLRKMEFMARDPLVIRALEIEKELQKGVKKPFKEIIQVNVGDAHAMGQRSITFLRQVLTLTVSPNLLDDPSYPEDAKARARVLLEGCKGGSVSSYSESAGIEVIRKHVANYIQQRDGGIPSDCRNIILSNGASDGIKVLFNHLR